MQTILLVDDDECFQFLCERVIKRSGENITLLKAYDGLEALELLQDGGAKPDLILLDINMPRMNGHEFLAKYSEAAPGEIPIVAMLTSSDQQRDRDSAMQYQFVKDYLVKPFQLEDIERLKGVFSDLQTATA